MPTLTGTSPHPRDEAVTLGRRAACLSYLFLRAASRRGLVPEPGRVPVTAWREIWAGLQLLMWELSGLRPGLADELPPARVVLKEALQKAAGASPGVGSCAADARLPAVAEAVASIMFERTAWLARRELPVEVILGVPDEDALVEAMARLLWDRRHRFRTDQ